MYIPSQFTPLNPELQTHFPKVVSHFPLYEQFGSKQRISEFCSNQSKYVLFRSKFLKLPLCLPSQFSPLYPELQIHFPFIVSHFPLYEQFGSGHRIS